MYFYDFVFEMPFFEESFEPVQPIVSLDPGDTWQFQSKLKLCFFFHYDTSTAHFIASIHRRLEIPPNGGDCAGLPSKLSKNA